MPTIFIALQCCQCDTMQVKQQKKSSNKWSCVVCNQKQSVRKVYAQGFMAKEVRKFVQSFNMSRQLAEQNPPLEDDDHKETLEIEDELPTNRKHKRTDWSDYIDLAEVEEVKSRDVDEKPEDEFEPKIVTEMPKAVFKKPKLKNYSSTSKTDADGKKPFLPNFQKKNTKMKNITLAPDDDKLEKKAPWINQSAIGAQAKSGGSKWSCYITEDNDDSESGCGRELKTQDDDPFGNDELNDQRVLEEVIHPEFL